MKSYPPKIFRGMDPRRQAQVIINTINHTQANWLSMDDRQEGISLLQRYLQEIDYASFNSPHLQSFIASRLPISAEIDLRGFIDFVVPFERFLGLVTADENSLEILSRDQANAEKQIHPIVLVLDHLRSVFNVGSIFRVAECLGVEHIYLVGYTPTPADAKLAKTAMGTEILVPWSHFHRLDECLDLLKKQQRYMVGLETVKGGDTLESFNVPASVALFVGNERFGLSQETLSQLDGTLTIPMMGQKNSLNVCNALSIATFEMVRQWRK